MKPINIFYDHQIFSHQRYGGISRYFCTLIKEFQQIPELKITTGGLLSDNQYLNEIAKIKKYYLPKGLKKGRVRLYDLVNSFEQLVRFKKYDIYHPTYYNPILFKKEIPYVVTVYDMIHERFPQYFSKFDKTTERKRNLCEKASRIISISHNTKKDLIEIFSIPPDKIDVIHLSAEFIGVEKIIDDLIGKKFILFVGSREGYKNFDLFIEAVSGVFKKEKDVFLLVCGGGAFNNLEKERIKKLDLVRRVFQKNVTDFELLWAYKNALFFVFPSLYEGFGIPILEAFKNNCPVLLSNSSSFPEVAGKAGFYFNPLSINSITDAINQMLKNQNLQNEFRGLGKEQLKSFSAKKMALETFEVYKKILHHTN